MTKIPKYFYFRVHAGKTSIELEDASDIDVVEVVRCKDCKHSYIFEPWEGINATRYCKIYKNHYGDADMCVDDDDFCSNGDRKDGEQSGTD